MKKKKILIIFSLLLSIIIILLLVSKIQNSSDYKIKKTLKELGFISEKDSNIYIKIKSDISEEDYLKQVSNKKNSLYEALYFDISNNNLTKKELKYEDGISTLFIPNYDNLTQKLTYTYKATYNNSSVIYEGEYNLNNSNYTCENIYIYEFDIDLGEDAICDKIKYDVEDFKNEALTITKKLN